MTHWRGGETRELCFVKGVVEIVLPGPWLERNSYSQ